MKNWNSESGTSIVAVMVALALFGIIAVLSSQSLQNMTTSGRRADSAMSARDAESIIVQSLIEEFRTYVTAGCVAAPDTFFKDKPIASLAKVHMKNVQFYTDEKHLSLAKANPPGSDADLERCNSTAFTTSATPLSSRFYGCFNIETEKNIREKASLESFSANRGAFIEVHVKLRNLRTDQETLCNAMVSGQGLGLEVYYALHWAIGSGQNTLYDSKLGSLNAAF